MKIFLTLVLILVASQAFAAEPMLLWNTKGDRISFDRMLDALEDAGGHPVHTYPPYFLAGYFTPAQLEALPAFVEVFHVWDDQEVFSVLPYDARSFASAWLKMVFKRTQPRKILRDVPPIANDVIMSDRVRGRSRFAPYDAPPYGGDPEDTSTFMIGDVSVSVILPESNINSSNTEDWTDQEIQDVESEIMNAMDWWALREPNAHLTFIYNFEERIPTSMEPIEYDSILLDFWINDIMSFLGYGPEEYPATPLIYNYVNDQRNNKSTDWGFAIFVVDSWNDTDGMFSDGRFAFAMYNLYGGGPCFVMTYDNNNYHINNMDAVAAHETGHIFGAMDQYAGGCSSCTYTYGYLNYENQNCNIEGCTIDESSIMRGGIYPFANNLVDYYARGQLGWQDTDTDDILDIEDTNPSISIVLADTQTTLNFQVQGSASVTPFPAVNPFYNTISINKIVAVQYRIDGGSWMGGAADDGSFDNPVEDFTLDISVDGNGSHTLECRAINDVGNMTDPVYQVEFFEIATAIKNIPGNKDIVLRQNYPNPFNPITTISFTLPEKVHATLSIFNLGGKLVRTIVDKTLDEGYKEATWDGTDVADNPVASGVYFYRLKAGSKVLTRKMVLIR